MTPAAIHHAAEGLLAAGPHAASPAAPLAFRIILDGLRGAAEGGPGTGAFAEQAQLAEEIGRELDREEDLLAAAFAALPRFRITWEGRQLAVLATESPEAAIAALLAERGYGYYTADVLAAELLPPVMLHDVAGNPIREARS